MATPWPQQDGLPGSGSGLPAAPAPSGANAWQNQMTPQMQQDAIRYGAAHPDWQGYSQIMAGYTPNQIMQGSAPDPSTLGGATDASSTATGLQGLFAMLQGQNAPQNKAIDLLKQQLGLDVGNETKLTGLKQADLRASTNIGLARANKLIENAQDTIANIGKQRGFVGELYGQANKQAGLQYGAARDTLLSDATARGAVGAHGTVDQFTRQFEGLQNNLAGNLTQRNKSLADLQLQDQQAHNVAQQYGIDKQQLMERLNNGLQQLGIQGQIDLGQLFKQSTSLDAQRAGLAQGMISQLIQMASGNPALMNQIPGFTQGGTGFSQGGPGQNVSAGGGRVVR